MKKILLLVTITCTGLVSGCKYYGSALPPDYPLSMDDSFDIASAKNTTEGGQGVVNVVKRAERPRVDSPTYVPQKEMALVAPPRTLLVWTYPYIADDNSRFFGGWSTIFLNDKYEWVKPAVEQTSADMVPVDAKNK